MHQEQEYNYTGEYHKYKKLGLLTNSSGVTIDRVNQFYFGVKINSKKLNLLCLKRDGIITYHNNNYLVNLSKIDEYLENTYNNIVSQNENEYCPYNYHKIYNIKSISEHYNNMINKIDKFLNYIDMKDELMAMTIRCLFMPNTNKGTFEKLDIEIVSSLNLELYNGTNNYEACVKLNNVGKPIYIRMNYDDYVSENSLDLSLDCDKESNNNFEKLYNFIKNKLLMDTPKDFLINNLTQVCGSYDYAEMLVSSYLEKNQYLYSIDNIASMILWKNNNKMKEYIKYFMERYPNTYNTKDNTVLLNFEGINKFLLNISEDDVVNFQVKEDINEMYYKSMNTLIYSFELLYKNK